MFRTYIVEPSEIVLYALADKGEVGFFLPNTTEMTGESVALFKYPLI